MRHLYYLLMLAIATIALQSCLKEEEEPSETEIKLAPAAIWIDEYTGQDLTSLDSTHLVFEGYSEQLDEIEVGSILISGIGPNAPYGYLRRVTHVQKNGSTYNLTTADAFLTDAFEELHVSYTKTITADDTGAGKTAQAGLTIPFPNTVVYDEDRNFNTDNDQIRLNGSITIEPKITIEIDIRSSKLERFKVESDVTSELVSTLTVEGSLSFIENNSNDIVIASFPLEPLWIPYTPLVFAKDITISMGINGSVNVALTGSVTTTTNVATGIEYAHGVWQTSFDRSLDNTFQFNGVSGELALKGYVKPAYNLKLYNNKKIKVSGFVQPYLKLVGYIQPGGCHLSAGIEAGVSADVKLLGSNLVEFSYTPSWLSYEKVLYTCPGTPATLDANFIASSTNIGTGQSVTFTDASAGSPTGWQWNFPGGSPSTSTSQNPGSILYSNPGTYNVSLTVTSGMGSNNELKIGYITVVQGGSGSGGCGSTTSVTDIDGNVYQVISIGNQCWMKENLRTTHYRNGDPIDHVTGNSQWLNTSGGAYCAYNNQSSNVSQYGYLYNSFAARASKGICPTGWHIPTDEEWQEMEIYLGMSVADAGNYGLRGSNEGIGDKIKLSGSNTSGLSLSNGGWRESFSNGDFMDLGTQSAYWTSSDYDLAWNDWIRNVADNESGVYRTESAHRNGHSCRCIKD